MTTRANRSMRLAGQLVWGRIYDGDHVYPSDDEGAMDFAYRPVRTASADIRGADPRVGQTLVDYDGVEWKVVSVQTKVSRYSHTTTVGLQTDVVG